ncbi:hypothetical protein [Winogradskya humida]|uniref:DUF3168 domain-containing protein n=1 Tax=Winogradskya humida TaxID=113566 RepID=A0ABQ4A5R3_9ACTN|nr:hypothetical protein [Actinoplanes humidus]GIE26186.1 hypothetical protein Ahu01nite_092880 [Actinoplanes humidus]
MPPPLTIMSIVGGGFEDKRWTRGIDDLVRATRGDFGTDPFTLTVMFLVPAEVWVPPFSGLRLRSYSGETLSVEVQVALAEHPVGNARSELLDLLDKAVRRAEAWGRRTKRITGPLVEVRKSAAALRAQVVDQTADQGAEGG